MRLNNRKLLVTGASRGIGQALSRQLLDQGATVIGLGRDFSRWPTRVNGFHTVPLDLSDLDTLPGRLAELAKDHPDLSGIVSNAGYGRFGCLEEFSPDQIRTMTSVNLVQHMLVARAFLPLMKKNGQGDLVFMGSEAALAGGARGAVYSACKAGLRGFAQSLRQEAAAAGVRVSIVNPGMVDTEFFNRLSFRPGAADDQHLRPTEVAAAILHILTAPQGAVIDEINLSPLKKVIQFGL